MPKLVLTNKVLRLVFIDRKLVFIYPTSLKFVGFLVSTLTSVNSGGSC